MRALCVTLAMLVMTGCGSTNPWEEAFRPATDGSADSLPEGAPITIRLVEMEQVREASAAAGGYLEERGVAPEDVTAEDDKALRRMHFDAFHYRDDPAHYEYLGHSALTSEHPVRRDDVWIIQAARERGANLVFIASEFVGRGTKYRDTPVWSYSTGSVHWRDARGRHRSDLVNRTTTTWVPVPVEVDRYSNLAMFYRHVER